MLSETCYKSGMLSIDCPSCGHRNEFPQPYPYHAGFGNQGFLYNDAGNLTLVWSSFDPAYEAIIGRQHPWTLTTEQEELLERVLRAAPYGGRWRFVNPARCLECAKPISGPISETISYLIYPGSVHTDTEFAAGRFSDALAS
jgi:hypothetical protein